MKNIIKIALLPCVAVLTLASAPAQAVSVPSNSPAATSAMSGTMASTKADNKALKQQAKLRKKCAKLASGKANAKKRAKFMAMCQTTSGAADDVTQVVSTGGQAVTAPAAVAAAGVNNVPSSVPVFAAAAAAGASKPADANVSPVYQAVEVPTDILEVPSENPEVMAVPEPGTLALLGLGLLGLGLARRRVGKQ